MTDDIVDQLELIETDSEGAHFAHVCGKAAETITRLRAKLAAERELLTQAASDANTSAAECENLRADLAAAREALKELLNWFDKDGSVGTAPDVFENARKALL